jgi:gluconolactonase
MTLFNRYQLYKKLFLVVCFLVAGFNLSIAQSPVPDTAKVELVAEGFSLSEGPYWHPDGYLLFSDVSQSTIYKWSENGGVETFLSPSGEANGIAADLYGNILIAQHDARQIGRIESNLSITPLATNYDGDRLHSPNDLVVKSDGAVFFTDPPWGNNPPQMNFHGVYRIPPGGGPVQLLTDSLSYPNGIAFSPDETKLYVDETNNSYVHVYDVVDDSILANGRIFAIVNQHGNADQTGADGMKIDNNGNLWVTGSEGVAIFAPNGDLLDIINVPGSTTNLGWGGTDRLTLFITNFSGLYKVEMGPLVRPDAPSDLQADRSDIHVTLTWSGSDESIKYVSVYRSKDGGAFEKILATAYTQTVTDTDVLLTSAYSYKVTFTDVMGFESDFSNEASVTVSALGENDNIIQGNILQQNYPNPFNPITNITYQIKKMANVSLKIFDISGKEIRTIVNKNQSAGKYSVNINLKDMASGIYLYRLKTDSFEESRKMLLIR